VKDNVENVGDKIKAKAESAGFRPVSPRLARKDGGRGSADKGSGRPKTLKTSENSLTMEIAQLFMSCLHAWGQDMDLDKLCLSKLGLICPKRPIAFGLLSRGGHMSLLLPGWHQKHTQVFIKYRFSVYYHVTYLLHKGMKPQPSYDE